MNDLSLLNTHQNHETTKDIPILRCWWIDEKRSTLITDTCCYCGKRHRHAYPGMKPGQYEHWSSHCAAEYDRENIGYYLILADDQPSPPKESKGGFFKRKRS